MRRMVFLRSIKSTAFTNPHDPNRDPEERFVLSVFHATAFSHDQDPNRTFGILLKSLPFPDSLGRGWTPGSVPRWSTADGAEREKRGKRRGHYRSSQTASATFFLAAYQWVVKRKTRYFRGVPVDSKTLAAMSFGVQDDLPRAHAEERGCSSSADDPARATFS